MVGKNRLAVADAAQTEGIHADGVEDKLELPGGFQVGRDNDNV